MRWTWKELRTSPVLAIVALAIVVATVTVAVWPKQRVTAANFDKIQIGMSQAELRELLGTPEFDFVELGLVEESEGYVTNKNFNEEQLRQRGFRDYRHQQWTSTEITISVISDQEGEVVWRYRGQGQPGNWDAFLRSLKFR